MSAYSSLLSRFRDLDTLEAAGGLMSWDQQVLMPSGGTPARTAHLTRLTRLRHELLVSDETQRLIEEAGKEVEPGSNEAASVRVLKRELDQKTKLPLDLVQKKAEVSSAAYGVWKKAKATSDFAAMRPYYEQLFDIARETSERLTQGEAHVYDALLDLYEEDARYEDARLMFQGIKKPISELVQRIREEGTPVDDTPLSKDFDRPRLRQFAQETAAQIGFDFDRGRLDIAPNAFCGGSNRGDIRMTTRASEHFRGIMSSSLHEMGHGLYEQGSPAKWDMTPIAGGTSLAVHESQSRLWENIVGRSRGFWTFFLPRLQAAFPELSDVTADQMWRMMSKVEPTFIRVGSDELTYNMHILVRFELEVEILTGQVQVKDLPEAWNAKYQAYLGITPPNDGLGCLQDVHWSRGSIGYFSTYAMGNLIGGAVWANLCAELGHVESDMSGGDFSGILGWLQDRIYTKGKLFKPRALVESITGGYLDPEPWLSYAKRKYADVYQLPG